MDTCWLKRKEDCFEIYIKKESWQYCGTIRADIALKHYYKKDSCLVEQNGQVEQILCYWDFTLLTAFLKQ